MYHYHVLLRSASRPALVYPYGSSFRVTSRALATAPPPQGQSQKPHHEDHHHAPGTGSNTLIILSAVGALGGLYYYYTHGKGAADRESARREEAELERHVRGVGEMGKRKAESVAKQGQHAYESAKADVRDAAAAAYSRGVETRADVTERARHGAQEAQAKFEGYNQAAEKSLSDARGRSEKKFEELKEEVSNQVPEPQNTKRSWFGWGK